MSLRTWLVPIGLIAVFLSSRLLILVALELPDVAFVANDISYYGYHLYHLEAGQTDVMREYPVPAVWILQAIYALGGGWETWAPWYRAVFILLDALVAITLYRRGNASGSLFWILFTGAQGAILWYRFDLIPAALVAWACLLATTFPRAAGAMVGVGAAVKLWPALLIGPMLAPDPLRDSGARRRLAGFVVAGFGLAAASLITSGWDRSASPISWQSDRGLQIESVPASPLMLLRTFTDNPSWHIELTPFNALEIVTGPGIGLLLSVSTLLTALSVALAVVLSYRLIRNLRSGDPRLPEAIVLAVLAIVLAMIVSNKTLSPQYISWLGGPVAALLVTRHSGWLHRHVQVLAISMIAVAALTQYTYPWGAYGIMAIPLGSGPETAVLLLRNASLVALLVYSVVLSLRASTPAVPAPTRRSAAQLQVG